MTTLALYVGQSDANGIPLAPTVRRRLHEDIADALSFADAVTYAVGTLTGEDENGIPELSDHYLIDVPPTASHLELFRAIARAVRWSRQRSFGIVGWSTATVVPVDPTAVDAWYLTGPTGA